MLSVDIISLIYHLCTLGYDDDDEIVAVVTTDMMAILYCNEEKLYFILSDL